MVKEEKKTNQKPRLSYDELVGLAGQLSAENKRLKLTLEDASRKMQILESRDYYERLSWLWRVFTLENAEAVFGKSFVEDKIKEFKLLMTPVESPEGKEEGKDLNS